MNDDWRSVEDVLSGLATASPDAARATRVRAMCHRKLARHQRVPAVAGRAKAGPLETAVVGGFCAVYVSLLALIALHTRGVL